MLIFIISIVLLSISKNSVDFNELGEEYYNKIFRLYLRVDMEYDKEYIDEYGEYSSKYYAVDGNNNLYKIINFESIKSIVSEKFLKKFITDNGVIIKDGEYYIKDKIKWPISNYVVTNLKIKEQNKNQIVYIAKSKFCELDNCYDNDYTIVENEFILLKENKKWIIDEFTFPMLNR